MAKTTALILAGGRGTRMDMLCYLRPKPALPFAGKFRVIDFSLSNCIHSYISDIGVLVDHKRADMSAYLNEWYMANRESVSLSILPPQGSYAGTADAVYQNLDYLEKEDADTVIVLAGDHIYKMDYREMIAFHHAMNADVTIGVVSVQPEETHRFGTVTMDSGGQIREFVEKSSYSLSNMASMGIYIFKRELLTTHLKEDTTDAQSLHDFGYNILPRMVKKDRVFGYRYDGYWQDIGTMEAYYQANMELLVERPRFSLNSDWNILGTSKVLPAYIENKEESIINSLISPGCVIRGHVENSILSPGVHIAEGAVIRNSIVMSKASIGSHSIVDRCILDEGTKVGAYCYVGFGAGSAMENRDITLVGKEVIVPDGTAIGRQCKVLPRVRPVDFDMKVVRAGTVLNPR